MPLGAVMGARPGPFESLGDWVIAFHGLWGPSSTQEGVMDPGQSSLLLKLEVSAQIGHYIMHFMAI